MVAGQVGLTPEALGRYFGSKRELYLAVLGQVEQVVNERFQAAAADQTSVVARIEAALDETARLSVAEPMLARFLASVTADLPRHPDLQGRVGSIWGLRDSFFAAAIGAGVATGEVAAADRDLVLGILITAFWGLFLVGTTDLSSQAGAINGFKRLFDWDPGSFVATARTDRGPPVAGRPTMGV